VQTDEMTALLQETAAEVITPRFRSLGEGEVSEKNPGDLVTAADQEAEVIITRAISAAYPDAVVLGEEATESDPGLPERFAAAEHGFTVDPVDGTKNFVHGSPDHAVMVAESRGGEVVRSWIWQPQHDAMYVAERGAGAFRNGERLRTSPPTGDLDRWRGVTSRRSWVGHTLPGFSPLEMSWVACGVDYPRLVEGACDFLVYRHCKPWDHAPGQLLVAEAGGVLLDRRGAPYGPRMLETDGVVAAADRATYDVVLAAWDLS
jgi:fructose-1,6-bisphosphatase/inositol monophosphatase family enzyme